MKNKNSFELAVFFVLFLSLFLTLLITANSVLFAQTSTPPSMATTSPNQGQVQKILPQQATATPQLTLEQLLLWIQQYNLAHPDNPIVLDMNTILSAPPQQIKTVIDTHQHWDTTVMAVKIMTTMMTMDMATTTRNSTGMTCLEMDMGMMMDMDMWLIRTWLHTPQRLLTSTIPTTAKATATHQVITTQVLTTSQAVPAMPVPAIVMTVVVGTVAAVTVAEAQAVMAEAQAVMAEALVAEAMTKSIVNFLQNNNNFLLLNSI
jgi:hypothetical protein